MAKPASSRRRLMAASLIGLAATTGALAFAAMLSEPASAQFFGERYPFFEPRGRRGGGGGGGFGGGPGWVEPQPQLDERPVDYSRAPAPSPRPADAPAPTTNVMVLGDSTADWLAYGLEEALADMPEVGIIRKHKAFSGLIRYETRSDIEWPQVAKDLLAQSKPNVVVVVLGLQDRQSIRDRVPARQPAKPGAPATNENPSEKKADAEKKQTPEQDPEQPQIAAPEPTPQVSKTSGPFEFRSEKWEEIYGKRVDDMIAVLKSTGAAVAWVGLPAIRGTRSTAEASYLNEIYRARAEKAGIFFIDVWDGFVDEAGRFMASGPDVDGQNRRLRTADGVHFTKFGARKLAHYVERELRRGLLNRTSAPAVAALPTAPEKVEPQAKPAPSAAPAAPAARPLAGPVLLLNTPAAESSELLGGAPARTPAEDNVARRTLVKGEAATIAMGRADDFAWPLRAPNTKVDQPLPPNTAPVASLSPAPPAAERPAVPTVRPAVPPSGQARVAGQPVLQGQHQQQPYAGGPRGGPQAGWQQPQSGQGFWRSAPVYRRSPNEGFFGLFR